VMMNGISTVLFLLRKSYHSSHPISISYSDEILHATYDFAGNQLIHAASSTDHHSSVQPEQLAWQWGTSVMMESNTLKVTTQRGI